MEDSSIVGGGGREGRHASQTLKRVGGALTGAIDRSTSHMTNYWWGLIRRSSNLNKALIPLVDSESIRRNRDAAQLLQCDAYSI